MALCVDRNGQAQTRRLAKPVCERQVVGAWKFGKAGLAEKRLKADHAASRKLGHFTEVARD